MEERDMKCSIGFDRLLHRRRRLLEAGGVDA